jgi:hypothetical protein
VVSEIGYIKTSFFTNFGFNKPAVTLFIFDFRDFKKEDTWDWRQIEATIIAKVRNHSDHWQKDLIVAGKYVLLILLPSNIDGVSVLEHRSSFKKAIQLSEEKHIKELSDYFLSTGFTSLKTTTTMSKKFAKNIHDLVVAYYHEKKENIKRKQKRLLPGQI